MQRDRFIVRQCVVPAVVGADGSGTFYSPQLSGLLESIQYIKTDYADTADFTITTETSTETIWTEANVTTATIKRPRADTHSTTGAAALYAAGGTAVQDKFALADDRLKIAISNAGVSKTGSFVITILGGRAFRPPGVPVVVDDGPGEGGDGAPEWVPADATIYIDLVNDRAWTEADGEVEIDTLLGADANVDSSYGGTTGYSAANLTSDGYVLPLPSLPPALIGAARTKVLDAATIRVQYKTASSGGNGSGYFVVLAADGGDALEVDLQPPDIKFYSFNGSASQLMEGVVNDGNAVFNCEAITITSDRLDAAANGTAAITSALDASDRPPGNPLVAIVVDGASGSAIQSITIYDALPDTTGLSELSAVS